MNLNDFLNSNRTDETGMNRFFQNKRIVCNDGYSVSVQCSEFAYCKPRKSFADVSVYESFELGFPNQVDDLIFDYADDDKNLTDTVYGYVPREIVEKLITKHGGIKL